MSAAGTAGGPDPGHGTGGLDRALTLLEGALGYAGPALHRVPEEPAGWPTPCHGWDLAALLAHMEDALDAFAEASAGAVPLLAGVDRSSTPAGPPAGPADRLRAQACDLLGLWLRAEPARVRIGELTMPPDVLVSAAALEIAVHGWDVSRSTGGPGLPAALERELWPVARLLVPAGRDRVGRFAPPLPAWRRGDLPAWLGRGAAQPAGSRTTKQAPPPGAVS